MTFNFVFDDTFGAGGFQHALFTVLFDMRFKIVDIEQERIIDLANVRIDIAGDRDVDQKNRLVHRARTARPTSSGLIR